MKGYVWSKARGIVRTSTDEEQGALNLDFPARLNVKGDVIGSRCYVRCEISYPFIGVDDVGSALRTNVNNDPGLKDLQPSSVSRPYLIEINDNGLGVGVAYDPNDASDAIAVTRDGKVIKLEQLITGMSDATLWSSGAFAVNNVGTILGLAFHIDDMATHVVFLTDGEEVVDLQSLVLGPAGWTGDIRASPHGEPVGIHRRYQRPRRGDPDCWRPRSAVDTRTGVGNLCRGLCWAGNARLRVDPTAFAGLLG